MEVQEVEPVHHHILFCTLGKGCLISPEGFCKSKALWNWSWTRGKGIMVRGQGSESSKVVQQESPTCVWHSFVVFLKFLLWSAWGSSGKLAGLLGMSSHRALRENRPAGSGGPAPCPGKSLGAMEENQLWPGRDAWYSVRRDAGGSCCIL